MSAPENGKKNGVTSFRIKLLVAMMLMVVAMTSLGLFLAERKVAIEAERDLIQDFRNELATLHGVQAMRKSALAERCVDLVKRPRIHAALEDDALDLLYPSARTELRDLVEMEDGRPSSNPRDQMHAKFYRFLDSRGAVISPPHPTEVGELRPAEEQSLTIPSLPPGEQLGYLPREAAGQPTVVDELVVMPIFSNQSGQPIGALVLGFKPVEFGRDRSEKGIESGIWLQGRTYLPALTESEQKALGVELNRRTATPADENRFEMAIDEQPHLVFYKRLNPNSLYPSAYEVAVYPMADARARRRQIRIQVILVGAILLGAGLLASHFFSQRLSRPVEKLAVTSEENRTQRKRAEAALELTSEELQRSARFSADASHQLKTPVTVLRAGIDELMARENFPPEVYDQLSALLHQTYRITSVIDDLLLLSRVDAGRLQINFGTVNLSQLLEEWIDDLSALPDELQIRVETNFPPDLRIAGERSYVALIVQNLLENARKYNVSGGYICVFAREEGDHVVLCVENSTTRPISEAAREHIFERFHRCGMGENIPGHGLGLNLAREVARLHGGDLRLVRSDDECTEFEVRFRVAQAAAAVLAHSA